MKSKLNHRRLQVLYVSDGGARVRALTEILKNRGHEVTQAKSLRQILLASEMDVLVLDVAQRDEEHAQLMLEEIQYAGTELPIVMICAQRNYELCSVAASYAVPALIQDAFAPGELAKAVERCAEDHSPDAPAQLQHSLRYMSNAQGAEAALQDLSDYLERAQLAAAHSARALVASAELIQNVCQHAYAAIGEFRVEARVQRSRLWLAIRDQGVGMQQEHAKLDAMPSLLPSMQRPKPISRGAAVVFGGLSRAARLADSFSSHCDQQGSNLELEFELSPVACSSDELPELKLLEPTCMRALVRSVEAGKVLLEELSPVLALTVQLLLGQESAPLRLLRKV